MPDLGTPANPLQIHHTPTLQIFVDESGDLGWNFARPFGQGGSSRYLTLACLILPDPHRRRAGDIISRFYAEYKWQKEKKASNASHPQRVKFCDHLSDLLYRYPDIKVDVITVNKINVQAHIRADANKLYNYMLGLVLPDHVQAQTEFELVTDARSIKVKSANSLADYLQIKLWFDLNCATKVIHRPGNSAGNYTLQFVDWIAHCAWRHYEQSDSECCDKIKACAKVRHLFF